MICMCRGSIRSIKPTGQVSSASGNSVWLVYDDDQLGLVITGRRLAGEDFHPWHPVDFRFGTNRLIQRDGVQQVEQLAFVFVDSLGLDVEDRIDGGRDAGALEGMFGEAALVVGLDGAEGGFFHTDG